VVFDPTASNAATTYLGGDLKDIKVSGHAVKIVVVNIRLPTPSKAQK
jgi:hypothetical protein